MNRRLRDLAWLLPLALCHGFNHGPPQRTRDDRRIGGRTGGIRHVYKIWFCGALVYFVTSAEGKAARRRAAARVALPAAFLVRWRRA